MRKTLVLLSGLVAAPAFATTPAPKIDPVTKKPLLAMAVVLPGTKRVLGYEKVKPYTPPEGYSDPPVEPTDVKQVEITEDKEALVLQHATISPLLGAVVEGARVPVRGVIHAKSTRGCPTRLWYVLDPFGYVCSKGARPSKDAPTTTSVLQVPDGERLPFHYVIVSLKEGDSMPLWTTLDDAKAGAEPERKLEHGDTVAIAKTVKIEGVPHYVSVEGKVFPVKGTYALVDISPWQGEVLDDKTVFPFGWTTGDKVKVFADATRKGPAVATLARRTRVVIAEESGTGVKLMLRIGDNQWVRAADVNEVYKRDRPEGITAAPQWIDVDLGEQVLVAYEGDKPVYATLTSSGKAIATPRGNYPVWAKVSSISMKSQPYEDKSYFVNKVPWVLFFQAHNAIHGAYWHDRFGVTKSHGCVNVAPLDARHLFEWLSPPLPAGWTGYRTPDLLASATVHIHNTHVKPELVQERPIGPPDKELEAMKLEEAETRRASAPPTEAPAPATPVGDAAGMKP